jgi:5-methylcytosine-specific restriction endonuclease McrA
VAISKLLSQKLIQRDPYCIHCGEVNDLVIHHRKNRQMGGSKMLDRLDNLLRVCQVYNGMMESDAATAEQAREFGHKLSSWQEFSESVFDKVNGTWYILDEKGNKHETEQPTNLF